MEENPSQGRDGRGEESGLRLAAIPGATPDKWADRWRQRHPEVSLDVSYYADAGQLERVRHGIADVGYVRVLNGETGPAWQVAAGQVTALDRDQPTPKAEVQQPTSHHRRLHHEGIQQAEALVARELSGAVAAAELHRVVLYREEPVVCAARDHWVAAAEDSVAWEEIAEEPFLRPEDMLPEEMLRDRAGTELAQAERLALQVVASGTGLLILPNSVARMLGRRDVVIRRVEDLPGYDVGLAWRRDRDDPVIQEFIGIARGRRPGSGRTELPQKSRRPKTGPKKAPRQRGGTPPPRSGTVSGRRRRR